MQPHKNDAIRVFSGAIWQGHHEWTAHEKITIPRGETKCFKVHESDSLSKSLYKGKNVEDSIIQNNKEHIFTVYIKSILDIEMRKL